MRNDLVVEILIKGHFSLIGSWELDAAELLVLAGAAPKEPGVYVFAMDGIAQYVGVASANLAQRLYFYRKPGPTQLTNIRMNAVLREALEKGRAIDIYTATPPQLEWSGWPVSGPEGLEAGIIRSYALPWNVRGAPSVAATPTKLVDLEGTEPYQDSIAADLVVVPRSLSGGKYHALCDFLRNCPQDKVSMTFGRIEQLVGPLPKSASLHRAWWANHEGNTQAKGWMPARFLAEPDPPHRSVVFRRFSY